MAEEIKEAIDVDGPGLGGGDQAKGRTVSQFLYNSEVSGKMIHRPKRCFQHDGCSEAKGGGGRPAAIWGGKTRPRNLEP